MSSDDSYKFRCMEYMNFVLDQLMSDDTKFKLYFSHIEVFLIMKYSEPFEEQLE